MPPIAVFACCTSLKSSDAIARCLSNGWLSGDSIIGSIGSNGLIKCAKIQIFGSDTSKTLNGPCALTSTESHGGGSFRIKKFQIELHSNQMNPIKIFSNWKHTQKTLKILTGIPAGRNRSKLCTGIMKQSLSNVDNEIGSFRVPTTILLPWPLKLTAFPNTIRHFIAKFTRTDISVQSNFLSAHEWFVNSEREKRKMKNENVK